MEEVDHYSIGEVAALLGVSPHAIRAWERRYGILSPERGLNRHRRYRAEDIEFLRDVKRTADVNGTSLRLAREIVNGSVELSTGTAAMTRPSPVDNPAADSPLSPDVWRAVGDAVPNLIMLLNADGVVVEANVAVARLLGVVRQRIAGRKFIGLVDPFDRAKASMLYRPHLRSLTSWELNIVTGDTTKLFSFSSWPVVAGETTYLVVIGYEMFTPNHRTGSRARAVSPSVRGVSGSGAFHVLQGLFDHLPVGVAVATVGAEPRIVYANMGFNTQLHLPAGGLLGWRVADVLGERLARDGLLANAQGTWSRSRRATRTVIVNASHELRTVVVRPMFSANDAVTSALIVVMADPSATNDGAAGTSSNGNGRVAI
ncbi:MAG TPA: MerR family transcriptional regulator [Candidatus Dormibacteraeota bacterium]|nr:MerR family transcriptional regulator [Candidatus Dormibacteraeota bacterium]